MTGIKAILYALADAIIPTTMHVTQAANRVAERLNEQRKTMEPMLGFSFASGLVLLQILSVLYTGTLFTRLSQWKRANLMDRWLNSPIYPVCQMAIAFNGMVLLAFYGLPECTQRLGYGIEAYAAECIEHRKKLLEQDATRQTQPPQTKSMILT